MKALEKDRARRYETANGFAADVQRYLADEPVSARPSSAAYRAEKFVRKHRVGVAAAAAVAAALVLGIVGTGVGLVRARSARRGWEQEAKRAQHQADRATALNDFMKRVLSSAKPGEDGRDVRVADLLDAAAVDLDTRFHNQPDLEVEARQALQGAYVSLGMVDQARDNMRRAYEASRSAYGDDRLETLRLASMLCKLQDAGESEPLARATYERARRVLGPSHPVTLNAGDSLAWSLAGPSSAADAEHLLRELIRETPTPPDEGAHQRLSHLAELVAFRGEKAEAIRLWYQSVEYARASGRDDPLIRLGAAVRLGNLLVGERRLDEAEGVYLAVLSDPGVLAGQFTAGAASKFGGSVEQEASSATHDYAALLESRGKAADATRVRAEHLARLRAAVPPREVDSPSALTRRAQLLARVGRFEEAAADYARAVELDPADHWRGYLLGCLLAYTDQPDAYREHCRKMLRQFGGTTDMFVADRMAKSCMLLPGATDDLTQQSRLVEVTLTRGAGTGYMRHFALNKGLAEYRQEHFRPAVDWLEESLRSLPDNLPAKFTATLLLAMAHHRLGDAEQARDLLAEARGVMEQKLAKAGEEDLECSVIEDWLICHVIRREAEALFASR
jgi:tetratricopeptide (TPR) repeat protein